MHFSFLGAIFLLFVSILCVAAASATERGNVDDYDDDADDDVINSLIGSFLKRDLIDDGEDKDIEDKFKAFIQPKKPSAQRKQRKRKWRRRKKAKAKSTVTSTSDDTAKKPKRKKSKAHRKRKGKHAKVKPHLFKPKEAAVKAKPTEPPTTVNTEPPVSNTEPPMSTAPSVSTVATDIKNEPKVDDNEDENEEEVEDMLNELNEAEDDDEEKSENESNAELDEPEYDTDNVDETSGVPTKKRHESMPKGLRNFLNDILQKQQEWKQKLQNNEKPAPTEDTKEENSENNGETTLQTQPETTPQVTDKAEENVDTIPKGVTMIAGVRAPKTYGFWMFYKDHSVLVGAVIGVLFTICILVICLAVYKLVLRYKRNHGFDFKNLSFSPFKKKNLKTDESPMYIRLSHVNNSKSGSHYVVSVLDDKKKEKEEDEWSSEEEEVFNVSNVKPASPAVKGRDPVETSMPIGPPNKITNKNNSFGTPAKSSDRNGLESEDEVLSNPATPATPATPSTPASDETDRSAFSSVSMDSGIESPGGYNQLNPLQGLVPTQAAIARASKQMSAASKHDHTTKEKVRRERIKDSCDQLRVLLPYIRGRKTDMASILEMCVDYLQIVNTVMPQQLHNQIVDILSKDPSLIPNKDMKPPGGKGKKNQKAIESPGVSRVSSTVNSCNNSPISPVPSGEIVRPSVITFQAQDVTKRDYPDSQPVPNKRLRLTSGGDDSLCYNGGQMVEPGIGQSLSTVEDEFGLFSSTPKQSYATKSAFSDVDSFARSYTSPSTEAFTSQLYSTYATAKAQTLERESYPVYMEPPLYHYYYSGITASSSVHQNVLPSPQSRFVSETMDYVNPNSVLSTASYCSNSSSGSRAKLECGELIEDIGTPSNDENTGEITVIENSP